MSVIYLLAKITTNFNKDYKFMRFKTNILLGTLATLLIFAGCSKDIEEYNKPAAYWYSKVISSVADGDLEKADDYYSSLQGEHIGSPLLPEATMILAIAHMHHEEYLLSDHFSNEYIKRYANANEREFTDFMKIKAKYMALPNPRRDQVLIQDAIKDSEIFKRTYPKSMYFGIVDTMLTNLTMAEAALNETIAQLYIRLDKPKSAEYYRNKTPQPWMNWDEIDRANTPWYREWFEGDGTESWYAFMIPDTQSVVSRNTVKDEPVVVPTTEVAESLTTEPIIVDEVMQEEVINKEVIPDDKVVEQAKEVAQEETIEDIKETKAAQPEKVKEVDEFEEVEKEVVSTKADEIEQARYLRDKGVLSKDEYELLKNAILSR